MGFVKFILFLLVPILSFAEGYKFKGQHYVAEFYGCCEAIERPEFIKWNLLEACEDAGATILEVSDFTFSNSGYTCVILLSESHASIHTYPEYNACFIDIFTCGDDTDIIKFRDWLIDFFSPETVIERTLIRGNYD